MTTPPPSPPSPPPNGLHFLRPVLDQIRKLWDRVSLMPVVRWGTVTAGTPLRVILDGSTEPLPFSPQSTIVGLTAGDRVLCVEQHRRVIIVQRAGQPAIDDTGWRRLDGVLANGFTENPAAPPMYRKIGAVVYLKGEFYRTDAPGGSATVTARRGALPAGFRPSRQVLGPTVSFWGVVVEVIPDGSILIAATQARTSNVGYSIAGTSFIAEQ